LSDQPIQKRLRRILLAVDARFDSSVYEVARRAGELYEDFALFMERFHVAGFARLGVELACEALTLGLVGLVFMLVLAGSAFQMTQSEDWLKQAELAITFLDRYGNEVGRRGIRHDDAVPVDQYPDYVVKAVLATEDWPLFRAFRR